MGVCVCATECKCVCELDPVVDVVIGGAAVVVAKPGKITAENQIRSIRLQKIHNVPSTCQDSDRYYSVLCTGIWNPGCRIPLQRYMFDGFYSQ